MKPFNLMAVVFLVLLGAFVGMVLQRFHLEDQRLEILEDRLHSLEMQTQCEEMKVTPVGVQTL